MKKLIFLFSILMLVGCVSAQVDTASVFIYNLPAKAKIDSNYIMIAESPTTTYKVTWKALQRSMNFKQLVQTENSYPEDVLAITHKNATKDTTKGIKLSKFYSTAMKDSVETDIGRAETEIRSTIDSLDNALSAEINLRATIEQLNDLSDSLNIDTVYALIDLKASKTELDGARDSLYSAISLKAGIDEFNELSDSLDTAYSMINLSATKVELDGLRDSVYTAINLKANVSQYNALSDSVYTAYAQILLEAGTRHVGDSLLTASLSLKVSANDVYSLLEILPDSVKIQSDNILLDGAVVASSLLTQSVEASSFATYSGYPAQAGMTQNGFSVYGLTGDDAGQGYSIGRNASRMTITGANTSNRGLDVAGTITENGSANINAGNISSYALTYLPSHGNEAHSSTFITAEDVPAEETDPDFNAWDKSTGISITESQISDLGSYITSESDPIFASSSWYTTVNNSGNWDTAYGWGDHAGLYLPVSGAGDIYTHDADEFVSISSAPWQYEGYITADALTGYATQEWVDGLYYTADYISANFIESGTLATVATSGSYTDLINKPTLFDGTWSSLTGKPSFATVATSGSYTDLSNKPTIPTISVSAPTEQYFGDLDIYIYTANLIVNGTTLTTIVTSIER